MRGIKFPLQCPGCKAELQVEGRRPVIGQPQVFKVDCPKCESQLVGHILRPGNPKFPNHLKVTTSQIRPSAKLQGWLKSGEVTGEAKIVRPQGLVLPPKTYADGKKLNEGE